MRIEKGLSITFKQSHYNIRPWSVDNVKYWRLYIIRVHRNDNGTTTNEILHRAVYNWSKEDVIEFARHLNETNSLQKGDRLIAYERKGMRNRKGGGNT